MDLADKLKMALDEGRLLILGAQVVSGSARDLPTAAYAHGGTPDHALDDASDGRQGEDRKDALRVASTCAGVAMVPMTLGVGATTFVVFESLFNRNIGVLAGTTFAIVAFSFLCALGLVLRIRKQPFVLPDQLGAACPLAVGIAADICVVGFKITGGALLASLMGCVSLLILVMFWFLYTLWLRHARGARF